MNLNSRGFSKCHNWQREPCLQTQDNASPLPDYCSVNNLASIRGEGKKKINVRPSSHDVKFIDKGETHQNFGVGFLMTRRQTVSTAGPFPPVSHPALQLLWRGRFQGHRAAVPATKLLTADFCRPPGALVATRSSHIPLRPQHVVSALPVGLDREGP